jgi:hypothetical protein
MNTPQHSYRFCSSCTADKAAACREGGSFMPSGGRAAPIVL